MIPSSKNYLDDWYQQKKINRFDRQFASQMMLLEPNADTLYLVLCILISQHLQQQHSCLPLNVVSRHPLHAVLDPEDMERLDCLLEQKAYKTLGSAHEKTPFVIDNHKMYLRRYYQYEQELCDIILSFAAKQAEEIQPATCQLLHTLFPPSQEIDWQKISAITALYQPFCVITGGPGTGKTTTVAKILSLIQSEHADAKIKLVAPTGKAAARLSESIKQSKTRFQHAHPELAVQISALPETSETLHRLLGVTSHTSKFRFNKDNPLDLDILLIDEASMIDLPLMHKLMSAIPEHARVIILGDPEQLASVEAGCVLSDLCEGLRTHEGTTPWMMRYNTKRIHDLTYLCQIPIQPWVQESNHLLAQCMCVLTRSHRFHKDSGIGLLAQSINRGDLKSVQSIITKPHFTDLQWYHPDDQTEAFISLCVSQYRDYLQHVRTDASKALEKFQLFRVLCATQNGRLGVADMNQKIEQALAQQGYIKPYMEFYIGRPLLIQNNDYGLNLFNGDIGMMLQLEEDTHPKAYFQSDQGDMVSYLPAQLPKHQTCFAMTIHKSQGSEFESVATVLSPNLHVHYPDFLSRELVYTAITRAKQHHIGFLDPQSLFHAAHHPTLRASGLKHKFWTIE